MKASEKPKDKTEKKEEEADKESDKQSSVVELNFGGGGGMSEEEMEEINGDAAGMTTNTMLEHNYATALGATTK